MNKITQGFVILASVTVIGASATVVYALVKGRMIIADQLNDLNKKTASKKADLDRLLEAATALLKD